MNTTAENITFMIVRGIVALAIVGLGFYCIAQGIHFFALPRLEAEQIRIHLLGLEITANGLGAVIFGTGVALCFVGKRTAPTRVATTRTTETVATQGASTQPETTPTPTTTSSSSSTRITEGVVVTEGIKTPPTHLD